MKESTPPVLKVSLPEAEELLQAEALEAHPPMGWSAAESDAASRDALAVAGKSDIQAFLLTRAKLVLSRMTKHDPSLKRPRLPQTGWLIKIISLGIIFLGFFSGAVTDQLTSAGAQLNLLSPPPRDARCHCRIGYQLPTQHQPCRSLGRTCQNPWVCRVCHALRGHRQSC